MGDVLQALEAIRRALDLGANVQAFVLENAQLVLEGLRAFALRTGNPVSPHDPFTTVGPIQSFTPLVQIAADSALTAVLTYAGFRMMWGRTTARSQFVLRVLVPRLLLATLMINFSVPLVQAAIDASNALSDAVVLATRQQLVIDAGQFRMIAVTGGLGLESVTLIILFAAYAVLAFVFCVRFALLVVLTILAPAAALLFVLPETHRYAREWGSLFVSALFMQPLQLLVLAVGFALDGYSIVPVRHAFALAAVWMTFKVPGALHSSTLAGSKASSTAKRHLTHVIKAVAKA